MRRRFSFITSILFALFFISISIYAQTESSNAAKEIPMLENPMTLSYLNEHLLKSQPRLVLNANTEENLKKKIKSDPVVQNMYRAVRLNAAMVLEKPIIVREVVGRRMLGTSREMLWRINMLGIVYRIEKDRKILERINKEVLSVCSFPDWNPSHFLDVAEMAMAVAFALDWTAGDLPRSTINIAQTALVEKGINPSWLNNNMSPEWSYATNNWNQVCHGGLIAASIAVADIEPELAAKTISRALDGLPHALAEYGPDGVYPEGSTYWTYGTMFSVTTAAMLESAFGHDFGHSSYPGFMESAIFKTLSVAPSGWYYNFADCGDMRSKNGDMVLAWFAAKTGNKTFFENKRFLRSPEEMGQLSRIDGAAMIWLAQYEEKSALKAPEAWKGEGANPVVIFKGPEEDPYKYYFGGKGGKGMLNHGNMDGGSFIFELNGIRWVVDPGNQEYHALEKVGFDLWHRCQDCERWTLLTKNNFGHSTLTINNELHKTDGMVTLLEFKDGEKPEATFDMTPSLEGLVNHATRTFIKDSPGSLIIEDDIVTSDATRLITWQLMTCAEVVPVEDGVILKQDGKELHVKLLSHPELKFSVISLDPPPLELDRQIKDLKRIELRIPAWTVPDNNCNIKVKLRQK